MDIDRSKMVSRDDLSSHSSSGEISDSQEESGEISSPPSESAPPPLSLAVAGSATGKKNVDRTMSRPKSQLTPRMALYIPPHLQRQTQQALGALKKPVSKSNLMPTPQQIEQEKQLRAQLENFTREYAKNQFRCTRGPSSLAHQAQVLGQSTTSKQTKSKLLSESWTPEMKLLLECKKTNLSKYLETGCSSYLHESKRAKVKLRKLLRKARSTKPEFSNVYENLSNFHAKFHCESPERGRNINHGPSNIDEDTFEGEEFVSARIQIQQAQSEWSEFILSYIAKTSSKKFPLMDVVKVEVIDSDEESQNATSGTADGDVCVVRYGRYGDGDPLHGTCTRRSDGAADSSSLDASNNEYLNQQFLRRQHDFEREQKYKQISSEARTRRSSPETFDDSLREYCQSGNRKINFDSIIRPSVVHAKSPEVISPPLFPIHPMFDNPEFSRIPEEVPREPFVKERRLKIYSPPKEISPAMQEGKRPFFNFEPDKDSHRHLSSRKSESTRKESREKEVYVRNYSYGGIEEYPVRELSPYSSRISLHESHYRRDRSLSNVRSRSKSKERRVSKPSSRSHSSCVGAREVRRKDDLATDASYGSSGSVSERNYRASDFTRSAESTTLSNGEEQSYRNYVSYPLHKEDRNRKARVESNYPDRFRSTHDVRDDWAARDGYPEERYERTAGRVRERRDGSHFMESQKITALHEMRSSPGVGEVRRDRLRPDTRMDFHIVTEARERISHRSRRDALDREHPVNLLKYDLDRIKTRSYDSPVRNRGDESYRKRKTDEAVNTMRSVKKPRR